MAGCCERVRQGCVPLLLNVWVPWIRQGCVPLLLNGWVPCTCTSGLRFIALESTIMNIVLSLFYEIMFIVIIIINSVFNLRYVEYRVTTGI